MYESYGIGDIMKVVQLETGMSMYNHLEVFKDAIDIPEGAYINVITSKYIEYIRELMEKHGINMQTFITSRLKQHEEYRDKLVAQVKKEKHEKVMANRSVKATKAFTESTVAINNNLRNVPFTGGRLKELHSYILFHGGEVYYIAQCKRTNIHFIITNNFNQLKGRGDKRVNNDEMRAKYAHTLLTQDITKAKLFKTREQAAEYLETIKDNDEIKNSYFSIESIIL